MDILIGKLVKVSPGHPYWAGRVCRVTDRAPVFDGHRWYWVEFSAGGIVQQLRGDELAVVELPVEGADFGELVHA